MSGNPWAMHDAIKDQQDREGDAYVTWCERNDRDPGEDHWGEFRAEMDDRAEDAAIEAAERRAEARADAMADRDTW